MEVKTQGRRDEQTVLIATTLAVILASLALGILGIVVVGAMTDMTRAFDAAIYWVAVLAIAVGIAFLIRHNP